MLKKQTLFDVVVIATMSAGKTTAINALLGKELLHSANEATTATITRIHDQDHLKTFNGKAYSYQNKLLNEIDDIDAESLRAWNADPKIKTIDLVGDIKALYNDKAELVLYDTPGPNNSQDDNHESLTMEVVDDGQFGLIIYILNATQLGVNDDRSLLEKVKVSLEKDKHKEIIFLLNKADMLDPEKGESIAKVVKNAENYLTNIGFKNPQIIPTAANYVLIAEKALNGEPLTRSQRSQLKSALVTSNKSMILNATIEPEFKKMVVRNLEKSYSKRRIKITDDFIVTEQRLKRLVMQYGFGIVHLLLQKRLTH